MRRITKALLGLALLLGRAASQMPQPKPPSDQGWVLRFDVDLVQIDAVVTDKKGNHVTGLSEEDFEVLQDGIPQAIRHLTWVPPRRVPAAPVIPGVSRQLAREQVQRIMVLVLDDYGMEFADFVFAQRALIRYIDREMLPGDLIGVVRTTGGSSAAQQLSSDPEFLRTVLRQMVWRPYPATGTPLLKALGQVVWGLGSFPGRKSVIVISAGTYARSGHDDVSDDLSKVADLVGRSSVTIHTIDVRGLPTFGLYSASEREPGFARSPAIGDSGYSIGQFLLGSLADMTAGLFQANSNDMLRQIRTAADDAEGYYLLGWYPGPYAFSARPEQAGYHNVRVRMKRKGLTVRSRSGYYAVAGTDAAPPQTFSAQAQMHETLFSPFQNSEIAVRLTPLFGYDPAQGAYVKSLLHIRPEGIEFQPKGSDCAVARLEVLASSLRLNWNDPDGAQIHWRRDELEACGKVRERALRDGIVAMIRTPIPKPGPVQMRVAVRNLAPGSEATAAVVPGLVRREGKVPVRMAVGSAAAVLEVPDMSNAKFALSGVSLRRPGAPSASAETVARLTAEGDPATRVFHAGDSLIYEFELFGRLRGVESRMKLMRDGKAVYAGEPLGAKPGAPFAGTYKLDATAELGKYLLGVVATDPKRKGKGSITQWIDFEIIR